LLLKRTGYRLSDCTSGLIAQQTVLKEMVLLTIVKMNAGLALTEITMGLIQHEVGCCGIVAKVQVHLRLTQM
jgi:hypothetical protein